MLLDVADGQLNNDPGRAQRIAEACAELAGCADAPAALPRARYIRAGAHNVNGEFEEDIRLTRAAHDEYLVLGLRAEAIRTNVGLMSGLINLGRYGEALDIAQQVLDTLEDTYDHELSPRKIRLMIALINQNCGLCYEYMGRYHESLDAFAVAEEVYRDFGMTERVGQISDNRGSVLSVLGRGTEALAAHEAAARIFGDAGLTLSQVMSLGNIGETHLRLANYAESLGAFEQARRLLGALGGPADEYLLLRDTADAYLALNLYAEALAAYREADAMLQDAGMAHDRARTLWGMGSALVASRMLDEAEGVLAEAAGLFLEAGNVPMLSSVMLEQASLLAVRGSTTVARETVQRALDLVLGRNWPVQEVYARLRFADLLLPDREAEAEAHLLAAQQLSDRLALPQLSYRLNERLGNLRRLQGRDEEARRLLEAAVDEIERLHGTVAQDAMRVSFLGDKIAAYEGLLLLHLSGGGQRSAGLAYDVVERAKSRALVDLITGVVRRKASGVADPSLEDRGRTLQADLNAIYSELLEDLGDDGPRAPSRDLQARATELEQEIKTLRLRAAADGHTVDLFTVPVPQGVVRNDVASGTLLLTYYVVDEEILAFVKTAGHTQVLRKVGTISKTRRLLQKLETQWERFRAGQRFAERHMAMLERSTRHLLTQLYDELVSPLEPMLGEIAHIAGTDEAVKLTVVPHGPLHRVPFHALFDGEQYMLEKFDISYAPSATVYALCQRMTVGKSGRALVFGVEDPSIPAAVSEAHAVAGHVPGAATRVGEEATVATLRNEAPGCDVLHMACHGLFRADNPMFSSLKLHDGWLTGADVVDLDLPGTLVALSACESGRNEVTGGDEVLGLTRAFLGAGAATLVVSLWLAQDETTAELMEDWYERIRDGKGRATALRAAQLKIKEWHPHPYYWAPFVLIGKR